MLIKKWQLIHFHKFLLLEEKTQPHILPVLWPVSWPVLMVLAYKQHNFSCQCLENPCCKNNVVSWIIKFNMFIYLLGIDGFISIFSVSILSLFIGASVYSNIFHLLYRMYTVESLF